MARWAPPRSLYDEVPEISALLAAAAQPPAVRMRHCCLAAAAPSEAAARVLFAAVEFLFFSDSDPVRMPECILKYSL